MAAEHEQGRKSLSMWPAGVRAGAASEGWKSDLEGMEGYSTHECHPVGKTNNLALQAGASRDLTARCEVERKL